jgi:hypothetical protein
MGRGFGQCTRPGGSALIGVPKGESELAGDLVFGPQSVAEFLGESEDGAVVLPGVEAVPVAYEIGGHARREGFRCDRAGVMAADAFGH